MVDLKEINILNSQLEYKGLIDDYTSFLCTRKYHSYGDFILQVNLNKNNVEHLQKGSYIFPGKDKHKCGIIMSVEKLLDSSGALGEQVIVKGVLLQGILSRRVIYPPTGQSHLTFINTKAETILKGLVSTQIVNSLDSNRKINNLTILQDLNRGPQLTTSHRFQKLSEEVEAISKESGLGWNISLNTQNSTFVFDVYEGLDRTAGNGSNPHAIFSTEYNNLESQRYVESDFNKATSILVAGQGEGVDRELYEKTLGETGLERFEEFVDARDATSTQVLESRADAKLLEMSGELAFEGMILTSSNLKYEQDYDLGDIVTVINKKWGIQLNTRIIEITEIYERDKGLRIEPVFGNTVPTLAKRIKNDLGYLVYQEVPQNEITVIDGGGVS